MKDELWKNPSALLCVLCGWNEWLDPGLRRGDIPAAFLHDETSLVAPSQSAKFFGRRARKSLFSKRVSSHSIFAPFRGLSDYNISFFIGPAESMLPFFGCTWVSLIIKLAKFFRGGFGRTYFRKTPKQNPMHRIGPGPIPSDTRHTYIRNVRKEIGNMIVNKKEIKTIFTYYAIIIKR